MTWIKLTFNTYNERYALLRSQVQNLCETENISELLNFNADVHFLGREEVIQQRDIHAMMMFSYFAQSDECLGQISDSLESQAWILTTFTRDENAIFKIFKDIEFKLVNDKITLKEYIE